MSHLGQKPWNKGRPWTDEEKAKCNGKPVVNIESGIVYRTLHEAARKTGVSYQAVWKHCNNKVNPVNKKWRYA